ncbi:MAG: SDR family oxidoreductase [Candidatus Sumerlaeia bacterium]
MPIGKKSLHCYSDANLSGRRILLTGATGHTGRRLAQTLLDSGALLRCLSYKPERQDRIPGGEGLEIVLGDAGKVSDWKRITEGIDTIVHMAHIRFAPTLVEALREMGRPMRLIVTSSTRLMSQYPSEIREVVRHGENSVREAPECVAWTILRPSMIFGGPSDNNLEKMGRFIRKWPVFPLFGKGDNMVQPLFVWDLVQAFMASLARDVAVRKTYVVAGPEAITYREMVQAMARAMGVRCPLFVRIPRKPAFWAARIVRPLVRINPEAIQRFGEDRCFDTGPALEDLGLKLTSFDEALRQKFAREV